MADRPLEMVLGENVAKYRKLAGMTQEQLAERVDVTSAFISRVERGEKMMRVSTLFALSKALGISCDALLSQGKQRAYMENIQCLLADQPSEYIESIEKIVRTCVEEFGAKGPSSSD